MPEIFVPGFKILFIETSALILHLFKTGSLRFEVVTESFTGDAIIFGGDDTAEDSIAAFVHDGAVTLLKDRKTGPLPKLRRLTWRGGSIAVNLKESLKIRCRITS